MWTLYRRGKRSRCRIFKVLGREEENGQLVTGQGETRAGVAVSGEGDRGGAKYFFNGVRLRKRTRISRAESDLSVSLVIRDGKVQGCRGWRCFPDGGMTRKRVREKSRGEDLVVLGRFEEEVQECGGKRTHYRSIREGSIEVRRNRRADSRSRREK